MRWIKRTHPNKSMTWRTDQYFGMFHPGSRDKWVFGVKETGFHLVKASWIPIKRHVKVKGYASPDDSSLKEYWETRRKAGGQLNSFTSRVASKQNHACPICGQALLNGEELHRHHLIRDGGFKLLAHASVVPNVPREACDSEVFFEVGDSAGAGPPAPWSIQPG